MMSPRLLLVAVRAVAVMILCRCSAATVTWDGGGDGFTWHDAANWSGNVLPGPTDDVVLATGPEVRIDGADVSVDSATVRRPLRLVNGGVTTVSGLAVLEGSLILDGGVLVGPVVVSDAGLVVSDSAVSANPVELRGNSTLSGNIPPGLAVDVLGASSAGSAQLTWQSGGTNRGTIRMRSINAGWGTTLVMNGIPLMNAGGGLLTVDAGAGGARRFQGGIVNEGRMETTAAVVLEMTGAGGAFLEHRGGAVQLASGSRVDVQGGAVRWTGGTVEGEGRLTAVDARVRVAATVTDTGSLWATQATVFEGNDSTSARVVVLGASGFGGAVMSMDGPAVNRGNLLITSENAGWTSRFDPGRTH